TDEQPEVVDRQRADLALRGDPPPSGLGIGRHVNYAGGGEPPGLAVGQRDLRRLVLDKSRQLDGHDTPPSGSPSSSGPAAGPSAAPGCTSPTTVGSAGSAVPVASSIATSASAW